MATHFHAALVGRLRRQGGSLDVRLHDFDVVKAAGVNIFAPIDGSGLGFGLPREDRLKTLADYYEVAKRHSDKNFLIMPNEEGAAGGIGGHNDLLVSKPVYWLPDRKPDQPFVENHPTYGKVYRIAGPDEMMEMVRRENLLIFMPHPRSKGSTGYPGRHQGSRLLPSTTTTAASACVGAWAWTALSSASARSAARRCGTR